MTDHTNPILARRAAGDRGELVPTDASNLRIAADNRAHDRASIDAGQRAQPITNWQEVADTVDEATWQRILTDLNPAARAECERLRPPAGLPETLPERQAAALDRLRRQKPAIRTDRQETQP